MQQVPNSWYPSMRDSTTISETPSVSTSRLLLPPSVTDLGNQRGMNLPTLPQLSQVQGGSFGDVLPDQDHSSCSAVIQNGGLDDPALQRALMRPPPRLTRRSYTKVKFSVTRSCIDCQDCCIYRISSACSESSCEESLKSGNMYFKSTFTMCTQLKFLHSF